MKLRLFSFDYKYYIIDLVKFNITMHCVLNFYLSIVCYSHTHLVALTIVYYCTNDVRIQSIHHNGLWSVTKLIPNHPFLHRHTPQKPYILKLLISFKLKLALLWCHLILVSQGIFWPIKCSRHHHHHIVLFNVMSATMTIFMAKTIIKTTIKKNKQTNT